MTDSVDLTPAVLDLALYAGDGEDFQIVFKDENDQALDVSGMTWNSQIRKTRTSTDAADLEIDTSDAATGTIVVRVSAAITRNLAPTGQWDLQYTTADRTDPVTILQGAVTCAQDVTREEAP